MASAAARARLPLVATVLAAVASTFLLASVGANQDMDALSALRSGLQDPNDALTSWDTQLVDPCTWDHITCDGNNRVTRIDLGNQNLSGPLSPELGKMDQLQYLEINHNGLTGPIPTELAELSNLRDVYKDFSYNDLCGPIPTSEPFQNIPPSRFTNNPRLGGSC